jgi:hypothetical protein
MLSSMVIVTLYMTMITTLTKLWPNDRGEKPFVFQSVTGVVAV